LILISTAHPWEVSYGALNRSLRILDQTLLIMYCVELTPVAYWIVPYNV
jgi:hypothetical protein